MSLQKAGSRVGLLGGTFDPIHPGHLHIAQIALSQANLDWLYFIPAGQNPHKSERPIASLAHRQAMIARAICKLEKIGLLNIQYPPSQPSYTIDTLRLLRAFLPQSELFWIIGADLLGNLHRWHKIEEIAEAVTFLVMSRPGAIRKQPSHSRGLRMQVLNDRLIDISSTQIRIHLAQGKPVDHYLSASIIDYIQRHHLYSINRDATTH